MSRPRSRSNFYRDKKTDKLWVPDGVTQLSIIDNWVIWIFARGRIALVHGNCGVVHQPEFPNRTTCTWCDAPIPDEVLKQIRDPELKKKYSAFGIAKAFLNKI